MNRRTLAIGLGMAAFVPTVAAGQEATPERVDAQAAIEALIFEVIRDGKISRISDIFAPTVDIDGLMADMGELTNSLYLESPDDFDAVMVTADGAEAMAFVAIGDRRLLFVYIHTNADGMIDRVAWSRTVI